MSNAKKPEPTTELAELATFPETPLELAVSSYFGRSGRTDDIIDRARQFREATVAPESIFQSIVSYRDDIAPSTESILKRAEAFEAFLLED